VDRLRDSVAIGHPDYFTLPGKTALGEQLKKFFISEVSSISFQLISLDAHLQRK
jgi:hypothetical protein